MQIVAYALRRKYTIAVLAILLALFGMLSARQMPTDILPSVDIPSVNVIWTYSGLPPREMAAKITSFAETSALNNVDNLREVTSETLNGVAVVRLTFQPNVDIDLALSQVTSVSQTILRRMPTGTAPPLVVRFSQSSVPILQLVVSSDTMTPGQINDWVGTRLRPQVVSVPGIRMSLPYGAAGRQVMVDLDPERLERFGLAATDVARAVNSQNLTLPTGRLREGGREFQVSLNASPETAAAFADLPVTSTPTGVVRLGDVANVRDGESLANSIVRLNGQNAVLVSIIKLGDASSTDIVNQLMERLPEMRASAPPGMRVEPIFDQASFVDAAITYVLVEAVIVAALVALVVILFLASWRAAAIVLVSIPLALLASVTGLSLAGETLNLMTLGGLTLAIGILVDNAVVTIENIERHIHDGEPIKQAVLDGSNEVLFPELVSTVVICIVFTPILLLSGVAAYVFQPLALAVVLAMAASFLLSRTLVPVLADMWLPADHAAPDKRLPAFLKPLQAGAERALTWLGKRQAQAAERCVARPGRVALGAVLALAIAGSGFALMPRIFFPTPDAGLMRLHVRAEPGTRIEDTAARFAALENAVRAELGNGKVQFVAANIGLPEAINIGWVPTAALGGFDGELMIQLAPNHRPVAEVQAVIRSLVDERFKDLTIFFRPADATGQTLAGLSPTDIDVRFAGRDVPGNAALVQRFQAGARDIRGVTDLGVQQITSLPEYHVRIDRLRAGQLGLSQSDAINAVLGVLGSGGTVAPSFWADEATGISYGVQIQSPVADLASADALMNTAVRAQAGGTPILLRTFATIEQRPTAANISRATLQPVTNVQLNVANRDLGGVYADVEQLVESLRADLKPANRIEIRGQAAEMASAYAELARGLLLAVVLVYLIMVVNFQSWTLPLAALGALPFALVGAGAGLMATGTPLSVPALTGLIMVVGVSSANSVLVASFARDRVAEGVAAAEAAMEAARLRLRPVIMTALAMILGMVPMALGLGEAGAQNAPLGRVVIGGLLLGTVASLLAVPALFAVLARRSSQTPLTSTNEVHPGAAL